MPLKVHFLNVGRGDCTIIEFPSGRIGIVDIDNLRILDPSTREELLEEYRRSSGYALARIRNPAGVRRAEIEFLKNVANKLTDPLAYYDAHVGQFMDIHRLIITHPDMDHMTGLFRLYRQDPNKKIQNFWHSGPHDFNLAQTTEDEWARCPYDRRDWLTYKHLQRKKTLPTATQFYQGDSSPLLEEDGIEVWAPTPELEALAVRKNASNIISTVLKISYMGHSIVLGGDATADETWPTIYPRLDMGGITVLKASHHGRRSGYYRPAVKEMSPWLTITSVGERAHDATENYRRYSNYTVSLRKAGDIAIMVDDNGVLWYPEEISQHWKELKND
jgi:beta-lactamase superfamily II metal-dependent hydrolase